MNLKLRIAASISVVLVLLSSGVVLGEAPVPGQPRPTGSNKTPEHSNVLVVSDSAGVTIFISLTVTRPGTPGTAPSTDELTQSAEPTCSATPINLGNSSPAWLREGVLLNPGTTPWGVTCSDGSFAVAWVPVDAPGAPDVVVTVPGEPPVDPVALASAVLGVVPLPELTLGTNPAVGLVALPSWFWIDGYDGEPLTGSQTLGGVTVEVEVVPREYRWAFGDGGSLATTSPGQPYPAMSDVQHVYETAAPAGAVLELEVTWDARYRVNGGAWSPLGPVSRRYMQRYPVAQLQSVLTSR